MLGAVWCDAERIGPTPFGTGGPTMAHSTRRPSGGKSPSDNSGYTRVQERTLVQERWREFGYAELAADGIFSSGGWVIWLI